MFFALAVILLCSTAGLQAEATGETCTQLISAELHLRQQLTLSDTPLANSSAHACERTKATAAVCASSCPCHTRLDLSATVVLWF